jgi:hypothetical protein
MLPSAPWPVATTVSRSADAAQADNTDRLVSVVSDCICLSSLNKKDSTARV